MAASLAFFATAAWDTREGAFAGATTPCAGSGSLTVTFRHKNLFGISPTPACSGPTRLRPQRTQRARVSDALPLIADPSSISLCALEYSISEVRPGCGGASEIGIGQIRTCQISLIQIGPGEISV